MFGLRLSADFRAYVISCAILSLHMLVLAAMTAAKRAKHKGYMNPEDVKVSFAGAALVDGAEHPETARVMRAHRNMLDTLPIYFALGAIYVLALGPSLGASICFGAYTLGRIAHSVAYVKALQPWRTVAYTVSSLALTAMALIILIKVIAFSVT